VVLILFDLDLKIYFNGLENKCKRKEKKKKNLPAASSLSPCSCRPAPPLPCC
jgi:hypothetical protein